VRSSRYSELGEKITDCLLGWGENGVLERNWVLKGGKHQAAPRREKRGGLDFLYNVQRGRRTGRKDELDQRLGTRITKKGIRETRSQITIYLRDRRATGGYDD